MKTAEFLNQVKVLRRQIGCLDEKIRLIKGYDDKNADAKNLIKKLRYKKKICIKKISDIENAISMIDTGNEMKDNLYNLILSDFYIIGLSNQEIADKMIYSKRQIERLHAEAILAVKKSIERIH